MNNTCTFLRCHWELFTTQWVSLHTGSIDEWNAYFLTVLNSLSQVEALLKHRTRGGKSQYLVNWKNYGAEYNSWEPEENLENLQTEMARVKVRLSSYGVFSVYQEKDYTSCWQARLSNHTLENENVISHSTGRADMVLFYR